MEALRKNEHILRRLTEELLTRTKISGFVSHHPGVFDVSSHFEGTC